MPRKILIINSDRTRTDLEDTQEGPTHSRMVQRSIKPKFFSDTILGPVCQPQLPTYERKVASCPSPELESYSEQFLPLSAPFSGQKDSSNGQKKPYLSESCTHQNKSFNYEELPSYSEINNTDGKQYLNTLERRLLASQSKGNYQAKNSRFPGNKLVPDSFDQLDTFRGPLKNKALDKVAFKGYKEILKSNFESHKHVKCLGNNNKVYLHVKPSIFTSIEEIEVTIASK